MGVKVRERRGGWWLFIHYKGRRKAKRCASKKAAELAAMKIDAALRLGQLDCFDPPAPPTPIPTLAQYAESWLTTAGLRLKPSSVEQYQGRLKRHILPVLGSLPLTTITRQAVRDFIGQVATGPNRRTPERPLARSTALESLRTLSAILTTAADDELIPFNPCRGMGKYVAPHAEASEAREIEVFSREELQTILTLAHETCREYFPFIFTLARTGMRLGEALALEWRDVDFAKRLLLVRRSRRRNRVGTPKNSQGRRVDMSQQLAEVLHAHQTLQQAEAVLNGTPPPEQVSLTPQGTPIQEVSFRVRVWAPLLRRAGLRYRKPHTLRHTFASLLIEAGEPLTYIQRQLGHHSPEFTLRVYGHLLPRGDQRAVDVLDDLARPTPDGATIRNPRATETRVGVLSA